ncbi:LacI family DNA-binding transcriptional regulator [Naasia sp. SYSU D00057]|uniref:LacI family DNA-binding transcriptional regulator n=1 Tax=Naasia sp. SYSU D00057 TaxID=2817380 RepID=UPI0027DB15A3|nr:LacI family DNA-binding transcriptional regulator [Naasia sp. SYSU D00057]
MHVKEPAKRATAADVARRSGVSSATVSYVLNATPGQSIPEATRDKVTRVARELGYVPNAHARALAVGKSTIAVIDLSEIPYGDLVARSARETAEALTGLGYLPVVDFPGLSSDPARSRLRSLATVLAPQVVVTVTPLSRELKEELRSVGVERVLSMFPDSAALAREVGAAARAQVRYLHSRGHEVIGYCGTDEDQLNNFDEVRLASLLDEATILEMEAVHVCSSHDVATIAEALVSARRQSPGLRSIAAYNDEIAFCVLSAASHLGLAVPQELAVIGVDDSPLAAAAIPALTSVSLIDHDRVRVAELAQLVDREQSDDVPTPQLRVITRESA